MTTRKVGQSAGVGNRGKGRKPGVPNKLTQSAKEAFQYAFDSIGGSKKLAKWATEHPTEFYKLFARLIPVEQQLTGKDGESLGVLLVPAKHG